MSIKHNSQKIKTLPVDSADHCNTIHHDLFHVLLILLVAFASFALGRLSTYTTSAEATLPQTSFETTALTASANSLAPHEDMHTSSGTLVASVNGTKYHFPWCPGAQRIKEENLIEFSSTSEAQAAGYTKAANCKGLK
jgi:hypothetical protein